MKPLDQVKNLTDLITMTLIGIKFWLRVEHDNKHETGRIFLQVYYYAPCTKTLQVEKWHGRKWYLSEHMTDDEIVKTAYAAFKAAVEHEIMEGFKVCHKVVFNPHVDFRELMAISGKEVHR